ncbi:MAG: EAL domain-containing protein [Pseudomonadota bacterium]
MYAELVRGGVLGRAFGNKRGMLGFLISCILLLCATVQSLALEPVSVSVDDIALDITSAIDYERVANGSLKKSTAPDAEGIVRRVEIRSRRGNGVSHWAVFALANTSDEQIDRLIVAPHYRMAGSQLIWPDLDRVRIEAVTPSEGFSLDRQVDAEADVFFITLDPGAVITLIAEQTTEDLPKLFLWEPSAYKDTTNSYTLYYGIVLGISGLLAVFLTILFVIKGAAIFPATAALAWAVLAYICVDFGFWNKIVDAPVANEAFWRAGTEVFLAATLVIFVYAYLSLNRWHTQISIIAIGWILSLIILMGVAVVRPEIASGIARFSIAATVLCGVGLITYMSIRQFDRAIMLIPTWILMMVWVVGAGMTVTGRIENDIIQPGLGGGLVLVVLLLSFTVMQHAFAGGAFAQGLVSDAERSALALTGSGDTLWEWDVNRDVIAVGEGVVEALKLDKKVLNSSPNNWMKILHPNDRDRFDATLNAIVEHKRGRVSQGFRLRDEEGHYQWFRLRARPMLDNSGEVSRCIGTLSDITEQKKSEDRLLQDSIRDHLTGLENRELFTSRLATIIDLAKEDEDLRPSVFHIDIDGFREINTKLGFTVGDTILLTLSRRLGRLLGNGDCIARLAGDQFVLLLLSESEPKKIAAFADSIRRSIKAPIDFADEEIILSASIGIASWTTEHAMPEQMLRDAELAMGQAKKLGGDRTEPFRPAFRKSKDDSVILIDDLKRAVELGQIELYYQPIVSLEDRMIQGFEALMRWQHPKLGTLMPPDFVPIAEQSGLINELGLYVLERATRDFAELTVDLEHKCFVSVNISSRELLRSDIVNDISNALEASQLPPEQLKIELTESMVMDNPEYSTQILKRIKALGVGLSLDDFGTGYSSLSYLMKFPFDTIKIDKSFVQARMQNERLVIMRSIIALAHGLDQVIIAEGAEYESDVTDLLQLGCEYAQGYLFGQPMDIIGVHKLVNGTGRAA